MAITVPSALKKNDTIGLMCPSGHLDLQNAKDCIGTLQTWGFKVKVDPTVGGGFHYFSGTDQQRCQALQGMLVDKNIKAILCGRGGYGMSRIIDGLDFKVFRKHPKWIIGYSDITLLHLHLNKRIKVASLHAPMATAFQPNQDTSYIKYLKNALHDRKADYKIPADPRNRTGSATGELIGGNLAMLAHSIGSVSEPNLKNKLLFIEDVGEYLYALDRMLQQLRRSGWFNQLGGLIVGDFSSTKDTSRPFGQNIQQIIEQVVAPFSFPVAYNFPVGHQPENVTLKCGVLHQLKVTTRSAHLVECR